MIAIVLTAVIIVTAQANCDLCSCTGGIVVCCGSTIATWVDFEQTSFITELTYDRTLISTLPLLGENEYSNLKSVSFYNNYQLSCDEIITFQWNHHDIITITDQVCATSTEFGEAGSTTAVPPSVSSTSVTAVATPIGTSAAPSSTTAVVVTPIGTSAVPSSTRATNRPDHTPNTVAILASIAGLFVALTVMLAIIYIKMKYFTPHVPRLPRLPIYTGENNTSFTNERFDLSESEV